MARNDNASKTMRIDIPPVFLPTERVPKATIARKPKSVKPPWPVMERQGQRTEQIPIDDADFKELFQGLYDSAFITDMKGRIMDANVRASQFFGYSCKEFRERRIMDLILGLNEELLQTLRENLKHDQFTLIQAECMRKEESLFAAEIATSLLRLSDTERLCFFIRDITLRREAEQAVSQARDELQGAVARLQEHDRAKSLFVSNVSHELKTPLTSITYVAGNLKRGVAGALPGEAFPYLDMIREDCERLRRTVEDILDMSRIEAGTLNLRKVKVPFPRFVTRTVESLRIQVESAGLGLHVSMAGGNVFVECDPQKMERVIFNVVKNAIKYNVPGGSIGVQLSDIDPHAGLMRLDVTDTGIGIEPQYLQKVTERFFRVGEQVSGAGLGLSICKEILERHGGSIELQSPPPGANKGTLVTIRCPMIVPPMILFACDDEHLRLDVMRQLDGFGYRVASVRSTDATAEMMSAAGPDLVLIDWTGPGMDGGIVISKIRSAEALKQVPLLAITGADTTGLKKEILGGMGIATLRTPWKNSEELIACLEDVVLDRKHCEA